MSAPDNTSSRPEVRDSLIGNLKALPRPVWVLFWGTFVNKFGTFVVPFLVLYLTQMGFSVVHAGYAIMAYGAGNFLACGLGGYLADRIGRRKTIVLSMVMGAVSMVCLSQAQSFEKILALSLFAGLAAELYRPAASALLADLVPTDQRLIAFATYRLAYNLGWAIGPACAGLLAAHSYQWLFLGEAVTCLGFGFVAWFYLPAGSKGSTDELGWVAALRSMRANSEFLCILGAYVAIGFCVFQMTSSFSVLVKDSGFSAAAFGYLMSLNGILVVIFELPLTRVTKRYDQRTMIALGFALTALAFVFPAISGSMTMLVLMVVVMSFGEMVSMPIAATRVSMMAPAHMRGRYMGTVGFTWSLGLIAGPALGLQIYAESPLALWMLCLFLGLVAMTLVRATRMNAIVRPDQST